jgi:hypothetical protein
LDNHAAVAGAWVAPVAGWFALPARLLLTYMLDVVHVLANIPSQFLRITTTPYMMISFYAMVLIMILAAHRHIQLKNAIITEMNNNKSTQVADVRA